MYTYTGTFICTCTFILCVDFFLFSNIFIENVFRIEFWVGHIQDVPLFISCSYLVVFLCEFGILDQIIGKFHSHSLKFSLKHCKISLLINEAFYCNVYHSFVVG